MTNEQFLDALGVREGLTYSEPPQNDQPTAAYGITLSTLTLDRGRGCTVSDLKALTVEEARDVARRKLQRDMTANGLAQIAFEPLRMQLLDFGFESGMQRAIRWLQRTVGLAEPFVTGSIDARTLIALNKLPSALVNNALAGERAHAAWYGGVKEETLQAGVAHRAIGYVLPLDTGVPA